MSNSEYLDLTRKVLRSALHNHSVLLRRHDIIPDLPDKIRQDKKALFKAVRKINDINQRASIRLGAGYSRCNGDIYIKL